MDITVMYVTYIHIFYDDRTSFWTWANSCHFDWAILDSYVTNYQMVFIFPTTRQNVTC